MFLKIPKQINEKREMHNNRTFLGNKCVYELRQDISYDKYKSKTKKQIISTLQMFRITHTLMRCYVYVSRADN